MVKKISLCVAIVNDKYNSNIPEIINNLSVTQNDNVVILINSLFAKDFSNISDKIINVSKKHCGVIEGYNQIIDFLSENHQEITHVLFIDEDEHISKNDLKNILDEIEENSKSVLSAKFLNVEKEYQYIYNNEMESVLNIRDHIKKTYMVVSDEMHVKFNKGFFCVPFDLLKNIMLPNYLYTLNGCNYSLIFSDTPVKLMNSIYSKNDPYELHMNQSDLFYYFRNTLIIHKLFKKEVNINQIIKDCKNELNIYFSFYRYNDIKAILLGVNDFLLGNDFLEETNYELIDVSIHRLNYFLWTSNELDTFFTWKEWEKTREQILDNEKELSINNHGYLDANAKEYAVIDMYNQTPFSTFNVKKILNWDIENEVGYVTRKSNETIEWCINEFNKLRSNLLKGFVTSNNEPHEYHHIISKSRIDEYNSLLKQREENYKNHGFAIIKNRVVFSVGTRLGFCDNPKYILLEMIKEMPNLEYIWLAHKPEMCDDITKLGVKVINMHDIKLLYEYLNTAKILIYDDNLPGDFVAKKKQILINTWHGAINYKNIGLKGESFNDDIDNKIFLLSNPKPKYFIAGSKTFLTDTAKSFRYPKRIFLKSGLPRNDILFNKNSIDLEAIKNKIGIDKNDKVCLYAPTFRNDNVASIHKLDIDTLKSTLEKKFGGRWKILYRGHVFTVNFWTKKNFIDVTNYLDQQELLLLTDVLISDYSSVMWDASLLNIPVFIYAPDYYEYLKFERGFAYKMSKIPFKIALNNDELKNAILDFDNDKYLSDIHLHHKKEKSYDKGISSKTVVKKIRKLLRRL